MFIHRKTRIEYQNIPIFTMKNSELSTIHKAEKTLLSTAGDLWINRG
jgi:hypothetical protein